MLSPPRQMEAPGSGQGHHDPGRPWPGRAHSVHEEIKCICITLPLPVLAPNLPLLALALTGQGFTACSWSPARPPADASMPGGMAAAVIARPRKTTCLQSLASMVGVIAERGGVCLARVFSVHVRTCARAPTYRLLSYDLYRCCRFASFLPKLQILQL